MESRQTLLFSFLSAIVLAATTPGCASKVSDVNISSIAAEDVASWLRNTPDTRLVIDVRNAEDFEQTHISGAEHFDLPDLMDARHSEYFARHKTLVVYGQDAGSARATAAAKRLLTLGYRDVRVLQGGLDSWKARGLPIVE